MTDATFQDGAETPLYLKALDAGAVPLLSAYAQDAVFPISEMRFDKMDRRFALLINRFRWEDRAAAEAQGRPYERVRAVLMIGDVMRVATSGIDRSDKDLVLSLLDIAFEPGADGTGTLLLTLANVSTCCCVMWSVPMPPRRARCPRIPSPRTAAPDRRQVGGGRARRDGHGRRLEARRGSGYISRQPEEFRCPSALTPPPPVSMPTSPPC